MDDELTPAQFLRQYGISTYLHSSSEMDGALAIDLNMSKSITIPTHHMNKITNIIHDKIIETHLKIKVLVLSGFDEWNALGESKYSTDEFSYKHIGLDLILTKLITIFKGIHGYIFKDVLPIIELKSYKGYSIYSYITFYLFCKYKEFTKFSFHSRDLFNECGFFATSFSGNFVPRSELEHIRYFSAKGDSAQYSASLTTLKIVRMGISYLELNNKLFELSIIIKELIDNYAITKMYGVNNVNMSVEDRLLINYVPGLTDPVLKEIITRNRKIMIIVRRSSLELLLYKKCNKMPFLSILDKNIVKTICQMVFDQRYENNHLKSIGLATGILEE